MARSRVLAEDVKQELYSVNLDKDNVEAERIFLRDKMLEGVTESTVSKYKMTFHVVERDLNALGVKKPC